MTPPALKKLGRMNSAYGNKQLTVFLDGKESETQMFVNLTIYHVPAELLEEFGRRVVKDFPGGVNEAIRHIMKEAIEKSSGLNPNLQSSIKDRR